MSGGLGVEEYKEGQLGVIEYMTGGLGVEGPSVNEHGSRHFVQSEALRLVNGDSPG